MSWKETSQLTPSAVVATGTIQRPLISVNWICATSIGPVEGVPQELVSLVPLLPPVGCTCKVETPNSWTCWPWLGRTSCCGWCNCSWAFCWWNCSDLCCCGSSSNCCCSDCPSRISWTRTCCCPIRWLAELTVWRAGHPFAVDCKCNDCAQLFCGDNGCWWCCCLEAACGVHQSMPGRVIPTVKIRQGPWDRFQI